MVLMSDNLSQGNSSKVGKSVDVISAKDINFASGSKGKDVGYARAK